MHALTLSARGRIVGWMLLLVTIALAGSIAATAAVLSIRADELADDKLVHEASSFHAYVDSPSGRSQPTVERLLTRYLEDSVPDSEETFFSLLDGRPDLRSPVRPPARLDSDQAFVDRIAGHDEPVSGWWQSRHQDADGCDIGQHAGSGRSAPASTASAWP